MKKSLEEKGITNPDFQLAEKEQEVQKRIARVDEVEQTVQALSTRVAEKTGQLRWRIIQSLRRVRVFLAPHGTRRERFARILISALSRWGLLPPRPGFKMADYAKWIALNEPSLSAIEDQRTAANDFGYKPLISLVMPVWNTPKEILDQTISSALRQTYQNWELCIVDANSDPDTRQGLSAWSKVDGRLKIRFLDENKGIAENSNEALTLADGEFVGFLDHDDLLAPFSLFEVVQRFQLDRDLDVIYSDEDKINEGGIRFDPFFKPDFSPDFLRSVNYIAHFLVIRKALGDQMGWFREGYDGAQDYDLLLRVIEKARSVVHVPKILYHWRAWTASTASGADAKPYANTSGRKALQEHLNRIGLPAWVENGFDSTFYRTHYHLSSTPLLSIIIPSHENAADLKGCIDSILQKTTYPNFEIVIVENGSNQPETYKLYEKLIQDSKISILKWEEPFNFSRLNNWAARRVNGEVLLFLNNDTQVISGEWLEEMLQLAIRPGVGAVGAKLYYPDERIQHAGVIVGVGGVAGHSHKYFSRNDPGYFGHLISVHNVSAVTAACMMVRKQVFQEVHGFDENYILAFGDIDLCLRILQKGYLNVWTPYAELYHHESKTRGVEDSEIKQKRFAREVDQFKLRWNDFLQNGDPFYNPNLTLDNEDYNIEPRKID